MENTFKLSINSGGDGCMESFVSATAAINCKTSKINGILMSKDKTWDNLHIHAEFE